MSSLRLINKTKLEDTDGVNGVFEASGHLQIIIGTGTVNKVYDEFIVLAGIDAASKDEVKAAAAAKGNVFQRIIKTLGDVFVPIIPAIAAGGLIMGIDGSPTAAAKIYCVCFAKRADDLFCFFCCTILLFIRK